MVHVCGFIWEWTQARSKSPLNTPGGISGGGGRGSQIQKSGKTVKRLHRLAPNLVHVGGFVWEWTQAKYNSPHNTPGAFRGGGLGGHKFKCLGKLSNSWTDWHQIWYASADSSGNGNRLNTICPSTSLGGFGCHKLKSLLKLSNGWTDLHQIWHTCADSSGNGYTPNKLPFETQGRHLGVLGGQTFKSLEKLSNGWTDWHQLWFTSADSSGNGHRLNTSRPTLPQGAFWGSQIQMSGEAVKRLDRLAPNLVHVCRFVWEWS